MLTKVCRGCGVEKEAFEFTHTDYVRKDGTRALRSHCNECRAGGAHRWYSSHKEQAAESRKRYAEENKKHLKQKGWEYREKHRKEAKARSAKWYEENREHQLKRQQEYYVENKERILARNKVTHKRREEEGKTIGGFVRNKYEGIPCLDCGVTYPFYVMDFDHRVPEEKEFGIGTMGRVPTTPERIAIVEKEIAKCNLICSNCHREHTFGRYR